MSTQTVSIRALHASDLVAAMRLWSSTEGVGLTAAETQEMLSRFLDRNPGISSAAFDDGQLVGAVLGGHDGRRGYVYHLAVAQTHRGRGLGRALAERTTSELAGHGLAKATLMVYAGNRAGRAFWEHLGWRLREDLATLQITL